MQPVRSARRACALTTTLLSCVLLAPASWAAPTAKLQVGLTPEQLGAGTTISFGFQIAGQDGQLPPPVTELNLFYPANLGIATSGVGLDACTAPKLQAHGPTGCPKDSIMGYGAALVQAAFQPNVHEHVNITIFSAPVQEGHLALLFLAEGSSPIGAEIVFPGLVLPTSPPFGGRIQTLLPAFEAIPGGPYITVTRLNSTIGPLHLNYTEYNHGRTITYTPKGILLPKTCPYGGFPFAAEFAFLEGNHTTARATVPCPVDHKYRRLRNARVFM